MQVTWSIFPKYQQHLDARGLADLIRETGLDTTNLVVRDGYWVRPAHLAADTDKFVRAMADQGVEIRFATTSYTADQLAADPTPLKVFADHGASLTFIESRPTRQNPWEYVFFVDLLGHVREGADAPLVRALDELKEHTLFIRVLGSYPEAE